MFFRRVDDFMIDKVFQRVADMMARKVTPRALAQNSLMLASLLQIWLLWLYWQADKLSFLTIIFAPLFVMLLLYLAFSAGQSTKEGFIPVERIQYFILRSFILTGFIFYIALTLGFISYVPADIIDFAVITRDIAELGGLYFMACRTNPPARQTQAFGPLAFNQIK